VEGGKVLVHCKMGISRSASTVIAFAMKYYQWNMGEAYTVGFQEDWVRLNFVFYDFLSGEQRCGT